MEELSSVREDGMAHSGAFKADLGKVAILARSRGSHEEAMSSHEL